MIASRTTRSWLPVASLLGAVLVAGATAISPLAGIGLTAVAALACLLLIPIAALPVLIAGSALNRLAVPWGDSQVRLEILLVLLLTVVLANRIAVRTVPLKSLRSPLPLPLTAYLLLNLASTVLFAQEKTRGLKLDAEILTSLLTYILVTALVRTRRDLETAMKALWIVTVFEAALGLIFLLGDVVHLGSYGVQMGDFGLPMVYGTAWEANIFGSLLLGNFFLLLADYVAGRRSLPYGMGLALVLAGIAASLTRTVWVALALGLLVFALATSRARYGGSSLLPVVVGIPIVALGGLIVGSATPFAGRLLAIANLSSSSAAGRFVIFDAALADWRHHPLFGLGTGSFNFGATPGQPHPWLPSLFLLTLHDTGVVGFAALLAFIFGFYKVTTAALRSTGRVPLLVAGAIAGFTALLAAFQTTSGFWFTYPWLVTGLGVAAARLAPDET